MKSAALTVHFIISGTSKEGSRGWRKPWPGYPSNARQWSGGQSQAEKPELLVTKPHQCMPMHVPLSAKKRIKPRAGEFLLGFGRKDPPRKPRQWWFLIRESLPPAKKNKVRPYIPNATPALQKNSKYKIRQETDAQNPWLDHICIVQRTVAKKNPPAYQSNAN